MAAFVKLVLLLPMCILSHAANNVLTAFGAEGTMSPRTEMLLNLALIIAVLGGYLLWLVRAFPGGLRSDK